jgi:NTE family protein
MPKINLRKEWRMAVLDLVFEGGGAKGMAFVGALQELIEARGHSPGRLLGTSAGAITAALLAAGYTVPEMLAALNEQKNGQSVFVSFLGAPEPFTREAVQQSAIRRFLSNIRIRFVPGFLKSKLADVVAIWLAEHPRFGNVYSLVERGGWFSADAFVTWLQRKLDEGSVNGKQRQFSQMTLAQFYTATGVELSVVAADTTANRMLILNHNTAPNCPVVWAVRMSMGIPLLWQEVHWQQEWDPYLGRSLHNHVIVDGGMLSNFPISLFLAPDANVIKIMGEARADHVLGLLIDEATPVPMPAGRRLISYEGDTTQLETYRRLMRLVNTAITAHDNAAIELFYKHVVRLPAGGYGTTEFDMTQERRQALLDAGRNAMKSYLDTHPALGARPRGLDAAVPPAEVEVNEVASRAARAILGQ